MYKIDDIDIQIANLLVEDGRLSSAEIARQVGGISERAARYRIERMIREGIIQVRAIANPNYAGLTVMANVWLQVEADAIGDVARHLGGFSCITQISNSIGEVDLSLVVVGRNAAEIYDFVTQVIGKTPGVRKTTTSIVPQILKAAHEWKFPANSDRPCDSEG
jgi:Lrp/AsnC family transcriptional regulator for asnA, asnC and gidA